jgi:hypothetical protein
MAISKNTKMMLYGVSTVFGVALLFFGYKLIKGQKDKNNAIDPNVGGGSSNSGGSNETSGEVVSVDEYVSGQPKPSNDSFPLIVTMEGAKVWVLQSALKQLGQNIPIDGEMGVKTVKALAKVGAYTWGTNTYCALRYNCELSQEQYDDVISEAIEKGFDRDKALAEAKKNWRV